MKRLSIVAALVAIGVAVPLSIGSSHREAPLTSIDPTADDTDVYAYHGEGRPGRPDGRRQLGAVRGPGRAARTSTSSTRRRATTSTSTTPATASTTSGTASSSGTSTRTAEARSCTRCPRCDVDRRPEAAAEAVLRRGTAELRVREERFGLEEAGRSTRARASRASTSQQAQRTAPSACCAACARLPATSRSRRTTSGRRRSRTTTKVANQAITELPGGGKVFAGQRDDPFFVDLGHDVRRDQPRRPVARARLGNKGGKDDLAGYGVHSIVLQVPEEKVTRDGDEVDSANDKNAVVGVWASTERKRVSVLATHATTTTATTTCRSPGSGTRS